MAKKLSPMMSFYLDLKENYKDEFDHIISA